MWHWARVVDTRGLASEEHWRQLRHLHQSHFLSLHHEPQLAVLVSPQREGVHGAPAANQPDVLAVRFLLAATVSLTRAGPGRRRSRLLVTVVSGGGPFVRRASTRASRMSLSAFPWPRRRSAARGARRSRTRPPPPMALTVPPPTNYLDSGRPFVFMSGKGASHKPTIMCLVEKGVR